MGISRVDSIMTVIVGFHSRLVCDVFDSQPVIHIWNGDTRKLLHKCVLKFVPILFELCQQMPFALHQMLILTVLLMCDAVKYVGMLTSSFQSKCHFDCWPD